MESLEAIRSWYAGALQVSLFFGFILAAATDIRMFSRLILARSLGLLLRLVRLLTIGVCAVIGHALGIGVAFVMWFFIQEIVFPVTLPTPEKEAQIGLYVFLFFSALFAWLGTGLGMMLIKRLKERRENKRPEPPSTGPFRGA